MTRSSSPDLQSDVARLGAGGRNVGVGAVEEIAAANRERIVFFLTNPSDTPMYVGLGVSPTVTAGAETGLYLAANGGSLVIDNWTGLIRVAHAGAATKRVTYAEV